MSVNSHLTGLSNVAIVRDHEKESINRSIITLQSRLSNYFPGQLSDHFIFGSYSRGTILPRNMDVRSDVDYMIVFENSSNKPQTYLNQLRRFVVRYYATSEIYQSNPTIVLSLNHIRFELVPAIKSFWSGLQIPAKASDYQDWMDTDPRGFNNTLSTANQTHSNLIKPLVRILKYWNANASYPFESYLLEQKIAETGFFFRSLIGGQLKDYFNDFVDEVTLDFFAPKWKKDALERLKRIAGEAKRLEEQGFVALAETEIKKLLPMLA